jgi:serine/threonine protein kinase
MASQSPESGTAKLLGNQLPVGDHPSSHDIIHGSSHPGAGHSSGSQTSKTTAKRPSDSRVVVIPSNPGEGILPGDVLPDEKTVISAAKANLPLPELPVAIGGKNAARHLGETLVGARLEHYDLVEFVGGGGMGAVFRANDTRLGRTVAVKVLSRDQSSEENVRRFRNEAQSAARLDHRYIARVHYVGEDAGLNFIVFEFIEGINLRELVQQKGPLPLDEALRYTMEVAEALAHASARDVVHRDIKPSNVLVTPAGQVKVVDMGLARLHQVDSSFDDLTASGVTLGTFDYISPEQARDPRAADVRSDIYSLGCTLYFMLVGKPPFPDGSALQKLLRHNGVDPPDVRLFRPELPPAIGPLLGKMLAKRPVQRQQTAEELVAEIERMARDLGYDIGSAAVDLSLSQNAHRPAWMNWAATIIAPVMVLGFALAVLEYATRPTTQEIQWQLRPAVATSPTGPTSDSPRIDTPPVKPVVEPETENNNGSGDNTTVTPPRTNVSESPLPGNGNRPEPLNPQGVAALIENPPQVGPPPDTVASRLPNNSPGITPPTEVAIVPPKPPAPKVVVRPGGIMSAETDVVGSLAQGIRRAAEKGITEVELDFNGDSVENPFEIPAGRMQVHAAPGRKPRIVFRPELSTVVDQRQMIRLLGNGSRLSLQEIDVRLELPAEPSFGWTLFTVHQGQSLDLSNCVVTVVDQGSNGAPVHDQVSIVQLQTRRLTEMMKMEDDMAMIVPTSIYLSECFVRGEATFLSVPEELPVRLEWDQGLFVSTKRLIETGGTIAKPRWHGRLELALNRVTIAAQQGLFQMKRRSDAAHQLDLEVTSDRSIFTVGAESPLFEFAGMPNIDEIHFSFSGADNCYPREEMLFVRARPIAPGEGMVDFNLANRNRWASAERSPDLGVIWQAPAAADLLPHSQLPEHYQLSETSPHAAGFNLEDMPRPSEPPAKVLKPVPEVVPEAAVPMPPAPTESEPGE